MKKLLVLVVFGLVAGTVPAGAGPKQIPPGQVQRVQCHDDEDVARELRIPVEGDVATGRYALPQSHDATTLILFAHGYSHKSDSWIGHMRNAALQHGVISVTMDYRGTYLDDAGNVRGWFVKEGAADMIAAAHLFQEECASIEQTIIFGVSMGGNSSGLAVAAASREQNAMGGPLFDYWFDIEGAVNVLETYAGASALAPVNAFAANAMADIEDEMDGPITNDPSGYADLAVVTHVDEIAASGVKGVVLVHALEDGLVTYNQSREIIPELVSAGIATEMFTVAGKGDGESGTTITGYSGQGVSPFAGHASEKSQTHIVMVTAFDRLWQLVDEGIDVPAYQENLVPGI